MRVYSKSGYRMVTGQKLSSLSCTDMKREEVRLKWTESIEIKASKRDNMGYSKMM